MLLNPDSTYTPAQLWELLGIDAATLERERLAGELAAIPAIGAWNYRGDAVREWVQARRVPVSADPAARARRILEHAIAQGDTPARAEDSLQLLHPDLYAAHLFSLHAAWAISPNRTYTALELRMLTGLSGATIAAGLLQPVRHGPVHHDGAAVLAWLHREGAKLPEFDPSPAGRFERAVALEVAGGRARERAIEAAAVSYPSGYAAWAKQHGRGAAPAAPPGAPAPAR